MTPPDSRSIQHAFAILEASADDGGEPRPLTPCEKLACRLLMPIVGRRALVGFCDALERGNPLYRKSHMVLSTRAMERDIQRYGKQCK